MKEKRGFLEILAGLTIDSVGWLIVSVLVLIMVVGLGWTIWWNINNVCIKEESYSCSSMVCIVHDSNDVCTYWVNQESTCTRCIEWRKR